MKRNKKSLYNAITAVINTLSSGLFGLIVIKLIIETYGSDFNGLNSTAAQLVSIVMLLEGGFTIATNVALFKPYVNREYDKVNAIASATRIKFMKIGAASLLFGMALIIGYSFFINTGLSQGFVVLVLMMTLIPVSVNLFAVMKYRIVLQAEQKEYVISISTFSTNLARYITIIILVYLGTKMWTVSFTTMIASLLCSLILFLHVSKKYKQIDFHAEPDHSAIVGTKDVMVQKITGAFYMSVPIIAITLSGGGTMLASVYAVFNSVFALIKNILRAVIDAPRLGLGELAAEKPKERVWDVFKQYQLAVFAAMFVLLTTASVLIMPFIGIYTSKVTDIDYNQPVFAVMLVAISFFELLHLPSGHLINMTGNFRVSRNIQLVSSGILIIGLIAGAILFGIYGILGSVLITAILLTVLEVRYVHCNFFENKALGFVRLAYPILLFGIPLIWLEVRLMPALSGFLQLIAAGIIVITVNTIVGVVAYFITNKNTSVLLLKRAISILERKRPETKE